MSKDCNQITKPAAGIIKLSEGISIGPDEPCLIIAEIGQNHQGSFDIAMRMIEQAKYSGADCVKFQKSNLSAKFNGKALARPYVGPHSWGSTYGEHKAVLELEESQYRALQSHAHSLGLMFTASAMDPVSLQFLNSLNVPFIKIGSGDVHNKPLLAQAMSLGKPVVISTGMSTMPQVMHLYKFLKTFHSNFCLLHCVSAYPTPASDVNLRVLEAYRQYFPDINVGYSGHELGIDVSVAAVVLGAKVVERHFTLDKTLKGSDHICSLTPPEFQEMVMKIRKFEGSPEDKAATLQRAGPALGEPIKLFLNSERPCYEKLGKSLVAGRHLRQGEVLAADNVLVKVAHPRGIPAQDYDSALGRVLRDSLDQDESICEAHLF